MHKYFRCLFWFILVLTPAVFFCSKQTESQSRETPPPASEASSPAPNESAPVTRPARKIALLVGINKYKNFSGRQDYSDLAGCVNDVMNMKTLLIGKYEFRENDIKVLTDAEATHAGIVGAFQQHLIAQAERDDIVVFHYSGHGSQMKDLSGDETDGWDETIVPHDTRDPQGKAFDISDDELNDLVEAVTKKTKNVTLIFDCCNSGTPVRGAGLVRKIPRDTRPLPDLPQYTRRKQGLRGSADDMRESENFAVISACLSEQSAFEHQDGGKEHGALTYFLVRELESAKTAGRAITYQDVMDNVIRKVNAAYPAQSPQLQGARAAHYVFSDSVSVAQPYILADPSGATGVVLRAGAAQGLTSGSVFKIYKPGVKKFQAPEQPAATIELTEVQDFEARGVIKSGGRIETASRAVESRHHYADRKLRVYYEGLANSPALRAIKEQLDGYHHIEAVAAPRHYQLLLRQAENKIVVEGGDTTRIAPPVAVSDPAVVNRVVKQVSEWAKWFNVLSIENRASLLSIQFTLAGGQPNGDQGSERVFKAGDVIECAIKNDSEKPVYITILDLSSHGSIDVIYPKTSQSADALAPEKTLTRKLRLSVPPGRDSVKDILKIFATTEKIDFAFLNQSPIRGRGPENQPRLDDPLSQLLENAALGKTRGAEDVTLDGWTTTARSFTVRR